MTPTVAARTFSLPDLGEGLTEAEIVRWLVAEGSMVDIDQPLVEVETAKAMVEVPSPYAGRVATLHAGEGETLEVGSALVTVGSDDAAEAYRTEENAGTGNVLVGYGTSAPAAPTRRRRPRVRSIPAPPATAGSTVVRRPPLVVSPLVRRMARDAGVDLSAVAATGEGEIITRADVVRALAHRGHAPGDPATSAPTVGERRVPLGGFQKAAAVALARSRTEIPEATVWVDVDATRLCELRELSRADGGPGLLSYIARFVVAGLRAYPVFNARLDTERQEVIEYDHVHLGVAVQGPRGLSVPAVLGAEAMTTDRLHAALRDVADRARDGRSTPEEMTAGTFTLNNYGGFGVDGSAAIINHPQVAILGIGRIIDRPWAVDGEVVVRKVTQLSFVFDHRVCDGSTAAGFLRMVADAIENPATAIRNL
ncbi:dihydrolipoamide acetyltransferase family protein [Solicola gregarius]|uniref:Dihydrolipoamide acetyltransferase component of pyruvate dehydrogenase complex n=1 Tax=Solicola gregarius TaxID=2908642 RepID=A0AA46TIP4_9ACTN|nr:dihydrolipoamide acetyltransferase family protein [Solicola gregarius]UYM06069.1 2-oxo acid dehydrogenase subunit E2 [Solicola gregarius]